MFARWQAVCPPPCKPAPALLPVSRRANGPCLREQLWMGILLPRQRSAGSEAYRTRVLGLAVCLANVQLT